MKTMIALCTGVTVACGASADVLVSNLDETIDFGAGISGGASTVSARVTASRFTVGGEMGGGEMGTITGARIPLRSSPNFGVSEYEVFVYEADGSLPGALIGAFDATAVLQPTAGFELVTFTSSAGFDVVAGRDYYIAVSVVDSIFFEWAHTDSGAEESAFGWSIADGEVVRSTNNGATWSDTNFGAFVGQFELSGTVVPTPGGAALLAAFGAVGPRTRRG